MFYRGQIFQIKSIDNLVNPPLFSLIDLMKDEVDGWYYKEQLKLAPDPTDGDYWQIEKVLKTKVVNGEKLSFVKFLFYPGLYFMFLILFLKLY